MPQVWHLFRWEAFHLRFQSKPSNQGVVCFCSALSSLSPKGLKIIEHSCHNGQPAKMRPSGWIPRVNILGVGVSAINLSLATKLILEAVRLGRKSYVAVTGVHGVSAAQSDLQFRGILNSAFLNTPDGMPMSWVGRLCGFKNMDRVYGPDLMLSLCAATTDGSIRHFFYGGMPGVADELAETLAARFPGISICGTYTPPFRSLKIDEERELVRLLERTQPHIFWVGLSTPKQERFMAAYLDKLPITVMIGVGAAFDIHSGRVRQAPFWVQRSGLEWLFRLAQEPRRLWKRYLLNNPLFVMRILAQLSGLKRYSLDG
jgi:N-acetylglucosaminyldiphosphoundecaprenol N-acetyl-beta-D-mannosaminyltransferase